jgi:hypothetical protein
MHNLLENFTINASFNDRVSNANPAAIGSEIKRAGDGIRTHDVSLGKAAFYH